MDTSGLSFIRSLQKAGVPTFVPGYMVRRLERMEEAEAARRAQIVQTRRRVERALAGKAASLNNSAPMFDSHGKEVLYNCAGASFDTRA